MLLSNATGFTQLLKAREYLGEAAPAVIVEPPADPETATTFRVITSLDDTTGGREEGGRQKLKESLEEPNLPRQEKQALLEFLAE